MTITRWLPDTCTCIVDIDPENITYINWVQKCPGHASLDGQNLIDKLSQDNKIFKVADVKDSNEVKEKMKLKAAEKLKAINGGPVVKNEKLFRGSLLIG